MQRLTEQILAHAEGLPEGAPIAAKSLLHLGNRAAVDQALSRLAERGRLMRAGRGVYLRPVSSRFGVRAPSVGVYSKIEVHLNCILPVCLSVCLSFCLPVRLPLLYSPM